MQSGMQLARTSIPTASHAISMQSGMQSGMQLARTSIPAASHAASYDRSELVVTAAEWGSVASKAWDRV
jgi:hypothetical protein